MLTRLGCPVGESLSTMVTLESGTKCTLCPMFCTGFLKPGFWRESLVSFADFSEQRLLAGGDAYFCSETSSLTLKTGKGVTGHEIVPLAGWTGIHQLQRRILFFEDLKIFSMYLEILWRISGFQIYWTKPCRVLEGKHL